MSGQVRCKKKGSEWSSSRLKERARSISRLEVNWRLKLIHVNFEVKRKKKCPAQILHKLKGCPESPKY